VVQHAAAQLATVVGKGKSSSRTAEAMQRGF
jgi:hypothetical protein